MKSLVNKNYQKEVDYNFMDSILIYSEKERKLSIKEKETMWLMGIVFCIMGICWFSLGFIF